MAEVTFTEDTLRYASLFQDVTRTTVMDCLNTPDRIVFVVRPGEIGKAIGKRGDNVAKLRRLLNRDLLVVEFSEVPQEFIANIFRSYQVKKVHIEQRGAVTHATVTVDATLKGKAIGRGGRNLRVARDLISRHFPIESVSVA